MEIEELTDENVWQLTEEGAFALTERIMCEIKNKEIQNAKIKIISSAFDFRTVSRSKRSLIQSLSMVGFCFFSTESDKKILRGLCKRKKAKQSVF